MVQYFKIPCHDFNRSTAAVISLAPTQVLLSIIQDVLEVPTKLVSQCQEEIDEQLPVKLEKKMRLGPPSHLHQDMRSCLYGLKWRTTLCI